MPAPGGARLRRSAALAVLVLGVAAGADGVRTEVRRLATVEQRAAALPRVDGIPVVRGYRADWTRSIAHVRRRVPEQAAVRVVLPRLARAAVRPPVPPGVCDSGTRPGHFLWTIYLLAPRPVRCDTTPRYWLYVGVPPAGSAVPPPPGSVVVFAAPDTTLVRVPGGAP